MHTTTKPKITKSIFLQIISYSFPASAPANFPFYDVIRYGQNYVDYFHIYRATSEQVQDMLEVVPADKVRSTLCIRFHNQSIFDRSVLLQKLFSPSSARKAEGHLMQIYITLLQRVGQ